MTTTRRLALALGAVALSAGTVAAQGSLSTQGYGYPSGELSTRALGTGGSVAEFDPASPINPAALGSWGASPINSAIRRWWGRTAFTAQYDPEFRRVTSGGQSQNATLTRFPLIAIGIPIREQLQLGVSAATLLDRTFSTSVPSTETIGGETVTGTQLIESRGSMEDVRLGAAYNVGRRLSLGLAGHLVTGQHRVVSGRTFTDTTQFGTVSDSSGVEFTGLAFSAGAEWRIVPGFSVAGSYRRGGTLRAERNDTTLRRAQVPDRVGVGVRVDRLPGASFTASWSQTSWTKMNGLGASALRITDAPEYAAGVEAVGPRLGPSALLFRLGGRRRTLPFGLGDSDVRETAFSGGLGAPFTGGRAILDLGLQHASRSLVGGTASSATERAWTLSVGLTVRP
ncbi:hypothetical protein J421_3097 [Gemmatirosa kalamazoonensis]|uniref:Outer membrane protein transport protein (OMPP1/FadL/TodX) n=1 Tax=Gemmatirosa kalamazoonensis TaxID=861299 RepID=W0RHP1_9BACT|nr:hypothetical protein [Gemmatirosa kalamazoonensis]AHG90634.1 hypothetical protein J421_3097 [Gemmatirosa kalamazoonensis]